MPRLTFTAGEILTAANLNVVSDQTVMVFDDDAARTTAIPSPIEGMVTYLKDTDLLEQFDGSNFVPVSQPGILQVVSTTLTTPVSTSVTTAGTFYDVSGLSATITPSSASNKIMVITQISHAARTTSSVGSTPILRLMRDSTPIAVGDTSGSRTSASANQYFNDGGLMQNPSIQILDSPATTSAVTYKIQVSATVSSNTVHINRSEAGTDSLGFMRTASTITLMEVSS